MTVNQAITGAYRLQEKWVGKPEGTKSFEFDRIHASMMREHRHHLSGKSNATAGLIAEVRYELSLLGKVRKALRTDECPRCHIGLAAVCKCTFPEPSL